MPLLQALFWRFLFLEGVNAIKAEEKRRHSVWLDDATWSKVQYHYKLDGCTTQNDFIDKAIQFYCGYLQSEYAGDFLPKILGETLEAILSMFGDRIGRLLFKQTVEHNVMNHILASDTDIDAATYQKMRVIDRMNGTQPSDVGRLRLCFGCGFAIMKQIRIHGGSTYVQRRSD